MEELFPTLLGAAEEEVTGPEEETPEEAEDADDADDADAALEVAPLELLRAPEVTAAEEPWDPVADREEDPTETAPDEDDDVCAGVQVPSTQDSLVPHSESPAHCVVGLGHATNSSERTSEPGARTLIRMGQR